MLYNPYFLDIYLMQFLGTTRSDKKLKKFIATSFAKRHITNAIVLVAEGIENVSSLDQFRKFILPHIKRFLSMWNLITRNQREGVRCLACACLEKNMSPI